MEQHRIVSRDEWLAAHAAHLVKEKQLTRARDALFAERRALPWTRVEKDYVFDTEEGMKTLGELFDGRSQLVVKHFMFGPDWDQGCVGCSFESDHFDGTLAHLNHHDVTLVAIARAPLPKILTYKKRMGWRFPFVSSHGSDFNYDFHVAFTPEQLAEGPVFYNFGPSTSETEESSGLSAFFRDENGDVFHTFSAFGRGAEELLGTYVLLDLTAKGRNEQGPNFNLTDWVRHHDRYGAGGHVDATGRYREGQASGCCDSDGLDEYGKPAHDCCHSAELQAS